jgi:soluble lytic murein transglycosylase-like protein
MSARITNRYNHLFQRFSLEFFGPEFDWQWFWVQAVCESALNPKAISPAGAVGLMQLMPGTSADMAKLLGIPDAPYDPEFNIRAGICYDRRCFNIWKKESGIERLRFMFASYNAGPGNIIKAQRLATFKDKWSAVSTQLPKITGRHAEETINYVRRIERIYGSV